MAADVVRGPGETASGATAVQIVHKHGLTSPKVVAKTDATQASTPPREHPTTDKRLRGRTTGEAVFSGRESGCTEGYSPSVRRQENVTLPGWLTGASTVDDGLFAEIVGFADSTGGW